MSNNQAAPRRAKRCRAHAPSKSVLTPCCKIWLERDGKVALSDWRVELLELIQETGSLAAAAKRLKVPYRTAWYKLKELQKCWGAPLLLTESGGAAGGGSRLTTEAQELVSRFRRLSTEIHQLVENRYQEEFKNGSFHWSPRAKERRG